MTEFTHDRAGVHLHTFGKFDQRSADLHKIAFAAEQAGDAAALRGRHLDNGLVGLDRNERLVDDDVIALIHMPADDLRFLEAFAKIGK